MNNKFKGVTFTISEKLTDIETGEVKYKLQIGENVNLKWPLTEFNTMNSVLKLAKYGLNITQGDAKNILQQVKYLIESNQIKEKFTCKRIGIVKGTIVHPFDDIVIEADDASEENYIMTFDRSGTIHTWKENVFKHFKDSPASIFMLVSSMASIMLNRFKGESFIVEIHGLTSTGKSTVLKAAASVWGVSHMINEWNTTLVAFERAASYANNYPVFMDDTKKAVSSLVEKMIYAYSGGRSKGRGTASGLQEYRTWNNILLSTGEYSILNFAKNAGGAAARCISLEIKNKNRDKEFFINVYKGINENYGEMGYAFLQNWRNQLNDKSIDLDKRLKDIIDKLTLETENQVMLRLARSFGIVLLAAEILNEDFNFEVEMDSLYNLFKELEVENVEVDLAISLLNDLLETVDSERLFGKKYYLSNDGDLLLPVKYLNDFLGNNDTIIRKEWLERGIIKASIDKKTKKKIDYKKRHTVDLDKSVHKRNTVAIKSEIIKKMGYEFQY